LRDQPAIIHEDEDLIVIDKPTGLLSADLTGRGEPNVFDWVKDRYKRRRNRGGRVFIIHRLDKDASGLMVFALSERAFRWLKDDFKTKRVHRLYLGLAEKEFAPVIPIANSPASSPSKLLKASGSSSGSAASKQLAMGSIQTFLGEGPDGLMRVIPVGEATSSRRRRDADSHDEPDTENAKPAVTHYRVLASKNGLSLVQFRLETGRRNQIRVHMQHLGHPLVGDRLYGTGVDPIGRLGLHAAELGFRHPATGQSVRYRSDAPASFSRAVGLKAAEAVSWANADEASSPAAPTSPVLPSSPSSPSARLSAPSPITQASPDAAAPAPATQSKPASPRPQPALSDAHATSEAAGGTSWDHVAEWYDRLIDEGLTDHYERVILPGTLRLLTPAAGQRMLDVACGQGVLCRALAHLAVDCVGVDASPKLIQAAIKLGLGSPPLKRNTADRPGTLQYHVADARNLDAVLPSDAEFDAATCIMALMNIDPIGPVIEGIASRLKTGGSLVVVILHPAFRAPGQTSWGWDQSPQSRKSARTSRTPSYTPTRTSTRAPSHKAPDRHTPDRPKADRQYRRVDGYLSPGAQPIVMNPGRVASGDKPVYTWTYHRPIQSYVEALAAHGLLIERLEEWPSQRESQPGPRAAEENRARREIPMFLGLRALKR
jgi:23S rRNA-/tRNA-specific pseudouridylate synthase/ubiquinone/menaquinone biosynthesis C-methylase UbiE